ncbi:MAG: histidine phosphatase family protein, partial [Betaproteobacteria bacterium]|nr:histidine phosphatase family protein [Betaproteobacteria bacterium]
MTRLILVRHGETAWNRDRRMQGQTDTPLSDEGRAQARALGARLAKTRFAALYSSDLARAMDTARCVAEATGYDIITDARLRERAFGIFEGLTAVEIAARYPYELERFHSRDPDYVVPSGESARVFHARCLGCLAEIAQHHAGADVVVVTHGLVLDAVYRAAHAMPFEAPRTVQLLNASLNVFVRRDRTWKMESWGDVEHLV